MTSVILSTNRKSRKKENWFQCGVRKKGRLSGLKVEQRTNTTTCYEHPVDNGKLSWAWETRSGTTSMSTMKCTRKMAVVGKARQGRGPSTRPPVVQGCLSRFCKALSIGLEGCVRTTHLVEHRTGNPKVAGSYASPVCHPSRAHCSTTYPLNTSAGCAHFTYVVPRQGYRLYWFMFNSAAPQKSDNRKPC